MFIPNGPCTTHITMTEMAGYTTPPTDVNGERTHTHTKSEEYPQMGHRRGQKQQGLPGRVDMRPRNTDSQMTTHETKEHGLSDDHTWQKASRAREFPRFLYKAEPQLRDTSENRDAVTPRSS
jgi:hypothetical protein